MSLTPYHYKPLSDKVQSRVIELQPSPDASAPLQCTITELDVYQNGDYESVSYTWGEPKFTEQLIIDYHHVLYVTQNLRDALIRFRWPGKTRRLWVDAICINQGDDVEKSRQIPFMAEIYRSASSVLVWLGGDRHAESCLSRVRVFSKQHLRFKVREHEYKRDEAYRRGLDSVMTVIRQPWFSRRWIVQEATLNPTVMLYCGNETMSWQLFSHVLGRTKQDLAAEAKGIRTMADLWVTWVLRLELESECGLIRLLMDLETFQCVDGRDRIYALVNLASNVRLVPKGSECLTRRESTKLVTLCVDYTMTTEAVYTDLAKAVVLLQSTEAGMSQETYDFLNQAAARCSDRSQAERELMPSWVPDWRVSLFRHPFMPFSRLSGIEWSDLDSALVIPADTRKSPPRAHYKAVVISMADSPLLAPAATALEDIAKWIYRTFHGFYRQMMSAATNVDIANDDMIETFINTSANLLDTGERSSLANFLRNVIIAPGEAQIMDNLMVEDVQWLYKFSILNGRRMFTWAHRKLHIDANQELPCFGFGPDHMREGDEIMMESGSFRGECIIIRQVTIDRFELIGDAILPDVFWTDMDSVYSEKWETIYLI